MVYVKAETAVNRKYFGSGSGEFQWAGVSIITRESPACSGIISDRAIWHISGFKPSPRETGGCRPTCTEDFFEIVDGLSETLLDIHPGFPMKPLNGQRDIRLALLRVILGKGFEDDAGSAPGQSDHLLREFQHAEFIWISQVHRTREIVGCIHHPDQAFDQVIHIAERACLGPVPIDRYVLPCQCLYNEVADHPAVVRVHPGAVRIENPDDSNIDPVLPVIVEEKGLRAALSFVVAGPGAYGIDIAPVSLMLRMNGRVAIDLAGGGLKDLGPDPLGKTQHVDSAHDAGLDGLDRVVLIMNRGRGTGQVIYLIHLEKYGMDQVVTYEFKVGQADEMADIVLGSREEIIQAQHVLPVPGQAITEVGS